MTDLSDFFADAVEAGSAEASSLASIFGLRVVPGFSPDEAYLVDEAELRKALDPKSSIEIPVETFDSGSLRRAIASLSAFAYRPTSLILHPTTYRRTRHGFAMIGIRDALGGRRRGPGKKHRSRLSFRERKAAAMAQVRELWRRERVDQGFDYVSVSGI